MTAMVGYLSIFVIVVVLTPIVLYWWLNREDDDIFEGERLEEDV